MKNKFQTRHILSVFLLGCIVLAGCQTAPKPLYQWERYRPQVYQYFKGEKDAEQQISALERGGHNIRAAGNTPPPGYYAHLGMLYASLGKDDQVVQEFETEKPCFRNYRPTWIF